MIPPAPMAAAALGLALLLAPPAAQVEGLARRPAPGAALALRLELDQRMRFAPMDMPDQAEVIVRKLQVDLSGRVEVQGPPRLVLGVERFDLAVQRGRNEMVPLGADRMDGLALQVALEPNGPPGPVRLADEVRMDAADYAVAEPLVELLGAALLLGMPSLPLSGRAELGEGWTAQRSAPAALPGIPGLQVEVWSFFWLAGVEPCGPARCARLLEVALVELRQQRMLGDSTVRVRLEGAGTTTHRVGLADGLDVAAEGRFVLHGEVENHAVPGIPARFGTRNRMETRFRLTRRN